MHEQDFAELGLKYPSTSSAVVLKKKIGSIRDGSAGQTLILRDRNMLHDARHSGDAQLAEAHARWLPLFRIIDSRLDSIEKVAANPTRGRRHRRDFPAEDNFASVRSERHDAEKPQVVGRGPRKRKCLA